MLNNRKRQKERLRLIRSMKRRFARLSAIFAPSIPFVFSPAEITLASTKTSANNTLEIGQVIGQVSFMNTTKNVINAQGSSEAPEHDAGLWLGSSLVDDDTTSFVTGHNTDAFQEANLLQIGDKITFTDRNSNTKDYIVQEIILVNPKGYNIQTGEDEYDKITSLAGEGLTLQTCEVDDGSILRIIIAK